MSMTLRRNEPEHFTATVVMRKERKLRQPVVLNTRDRRLGVDRLRYEQANQEAQHIPVELRSFLVSGQSCGPVKK